MAVKGWYVCRRMPRSQICTMLGVAPNNQLEVALLLNCKCWESKASSYGGWTGMAKVCSLLFIVIHHWLLRARIYFEIVSLSMLKGCSLILSREASARRREASGRRREAPGRGGKTLGRSRKRRLDRSWGMFIFEDQSEMKIFQSTKLKVHLSS